MKTLITFTCLFLASSTFAQQDMFWNNYSNINPAMSGLQYEQHGAISFSDYFQSYTPKNLLANYNMRIAGKHGLGINFTGRSFSLNQASTTLNYNYQFDLGNAGKLSAGVGAGLTYTDKNDSYNLFSNYNIQPRTNFQLNMGVAYKRKQLTAGVSISNITSPDVVLDTNFVLSGRPSLNIHAEYDFKIGEQFQLTPRVIYGSFNGMHRSNVDLTLTFRNKFSLGAMCDFNSGIGIHAGWDIKEKFRVAYLFNTRFSKLSSYSPLNARHQITLGFKL